MRARDLVWLLALPVLLFLDGVASAAESEPELVSDEKTLKEAKVGTDGPALLDFFRQRTLSDADRARLAAVVRLLGDEVFETRQRASADLVTVGRAALPFLRPALHDADPEIASRALRCLETIEEGSDLTLIAAAARLLATRRPGGTAEVLLAYLPLADDEAVHQTILQTLAAVCLRDGKADCPISAALGDKEPARRAAAAFVLARAAPEQRRAAARLITDPDARVRFQAAAALVRAADKSAVTTLTALLTDGALTVAWQAEDLLCRIAGDKTPQAALGTGDDASRRKCRDAWEQWWLAHADEVDLSRSDLEETLLGLTVVCDCDVGEFRSGRLWECGADGKPRWQITGVKNPADVQMLPGGRVLIAECQGFVVTERDRQGEVLWSHRVDNYPVSCQRLPNGNTFIASYSELLEVTRAGKTVYSHKKQGSIFCAQKLRNGNILYAHGNGTIVEMETGGKAVRTIAIDGLSSWASVELLPCGRYLVAQYASNRVVEIDVAGKVYWECSIQTPAWATRLRNGHTLVASTQGRRVVELDRSGKEVWEQNTQGRPFRVRRH